MLKIKFQTHIMIHNRHCVIDESSIGILLKRVNGNVFVIPTDVCNLSFPTASDQALEVLFVYNRRFMFQDDAYEEQHSIRSLKNPEERPPETEIVDYSWSWDVYCSYLRRLFEEIFACEYRKFWGKGKGRAH